MDREILRQYLTINYMLHDLMRAHCTMSNVYLLENHEAYKRIEGYEKTIHNMITDLTKLDDELLVEVMLGIKPKSDS